MNRAELENARWGITGGRQATAWTVRIAAVTVALALGGSAAAQTPAAPAAPRSEPFAISDNSFLVEEAFNQERGIYQNIFNAARNNGVWFSTFTQEWPAPSQTHQLSYTLAWAFDSTTASFGDVLINYRFQALEEKAGTPAFSPRLSLVIPTGDASIANGAPGFQINLPFSKQTGDVYWHWNAGVTLLPSVEFGDETRSLESPFLAGSAIYRVTPMFHAMLESVVNFDEQPTAIGTVREKSFTLSPGVRGGWNFGDKQLVLGFALPITWSDDESDTAAFFYLSYELPFRK